MPDQDTPESKHPAVPREVWALGLVSMFMDISSEMVHSFLPVFLTTVLGASPAVVGLIEGIGEGVASCSKIFSGWLSDKTGRPKMLALIGYGMGALSKPFFAFAPSVPWVFGARIGDRLGKGIRGAPRDAMVADFTPPELRGAAFGLRQTLDTIGSFVGPILALILMQFMPGHYRELFWLATLSGLVAVIILIVRVREPSKAATNANPSAVIEGSEVKKLDKAYWGVVAVGATLTLARFSEAFLILRALEEGLSASFSPVVLIVMNVVYAGTAYPIGVLSDRIGRRKLLMPGFALLVLADVALASAHGLPVIILGIALWGLHMGMTQGVLSALVADSAPANLRGTSFGIYNLVTGVAVLIASVVAGVLWQTVGSRTTFLAGAAFTVAGLLLAFLIRARGQRAAT